jgi:hypothetical protein
LAQTPQFLQIAAVNSATLAAIFAGTIYEVARFADDHSHKVGNFHIPLTVRGSHRSPSESYPPKTGSPPVESSGTMRSSSGSREAHDKKKSGEKIAIGCDFSPDLNFRTIPWTTTYLVRRKPW